MRKNAAIIISMFLIPVVVSIIIFLFLFTYLNDNIRRSEDIIFDGIVSTVERDLQSVLAEVFRTSGQSNFRDLVNSNDFNERYIIDVQNKISEVQQAGRFIESIAFVAGGKFVISNIRFLDDENFEERFIYESYYNYGLDVALFENFLNFADTASYFLNASDKVSLLKLELPFFSTDVCAVIFINNTRFIQYINNLSKNSDRAIFIKDSNGNLIIAGEKRLEFNYDSAVKLLKDKNTIGVTNNTSGIEYYWNIPSDYFNNSFLPLRILMFSSIFIIVALLGVLIFLFVRKNNAEVHTLIKEKESYQSEFEKIKPSVLSDIFTRLFTNKPLFDSIENICKKYDLDLIGKKITLLSVQSSEIISYFRKLKHPETLNFLNDVAARLHQDIKKHFVGFEKQYVIDAQRNYYVVLTSGKEEPNEEIIQKINSACKAYQSENTNIDISFAVSNTVLEPNVLSMQYSQVEDCRMFIELLDGLNEIVFYDKLVDKSEAKSDIRHEMTDIVWHIKQKEFLQAKDKINGIIKNKLSSIDSGILKLKIYSIIDTLTFELKEATAYFDGEFLKNLNFEKKLLQINSCKQLQTITDEIFEKLHSYVTENDSKNEWIDGIKKYIKENYSNPNLNVSFLAEQFNFNLSYFSRMFKKETGIGVFDYIQKERIEKAKEMLLIGMDMHDICVKVGFFDTRAFIRTFKNIEGCTPSQFKRTAKF